MSRTNAVVSSPPPRSRRPFRRSPWLGRRVWPAHSGARSRRGRPWRHRQRHPRSPADRGCRAGSLRFAPSAVMEGRSARVAAARRPRALLPSITAEGAIPSRPRMPGRFAAVRALSSNGGEKRSRSSRAASAGASRTSPGSRVRTENVSASAWPLSARGRPSHQRTTSAWALCERISSATATLVSRATTSLTVDRRREDRRPPRRRLACFRPPRARPLHRPTVRSVRSARRSTRRRSARCRQGFRPAARARHAVASVRRFGPPSRFSPP
jgi:hypothetical protein